MQSEGLSWWQGYTEKTVSACHECQDEDVSSGRTVLGTETRPLSLLECSQLLFRSTFMLYIFYRTYISVQSLKCLEI